MSRFGDFGAMMAGASAAGGGDPSFANVVLLMGFEGTDGSTAFVDEKGGKTVTALGNAQIDTAQKKFGASSLLCDGTGDYLTLADHADFELGSGSWTIEFFVRFNAVATFGPNLVAKQVVSGNQRGLRFDWKGSGSNEWGVRISSNGFDAGVTLAAADTLSNATWYHACCEYDSAATRLRVYRDGVMKGAVNGARTIFNNTAPLSIGADGAGGTPLNGWMDELRITKGLARYASDGGFTVPSAAYPRS